MVSQIKPSQSQAKLYTPSEVLIQRVSVLIVSNEARFESGLRTMLEFYSTGKPLYFDVVGTANAEEAIALTMQQQPDLILLDLESFEKESGIATLLNLRELPNRVKVLVLSAFQDAESIFKVMEAGAIGYVLKEQLPSQLHHAMTTAIANQVYLCPEVATRFFKIFQANSERSHPSSSIHFTNREREVLNLLLEGANNEKIAQELYITIATVKAHLTGIFEKLEVNSRSLAIVKAFKLGICQ